MTAEPMIIDSFAGGGGASTGIELALGRSPDVAINHSEAALALHAVNHPETLHLNSNIWDVEPRSVTQGRPVGLLWASPDCKHFSKAKGGAVRDRNIRDLAWVVVKWAEEVKPDVILMENVEEFQTWGPLGEDGQPIKEFAGLTFIDWLTRLKRAGYKVQHRELRACDFGAPTIRKRWFLVARRDGLPIVWPKPTHGDPKSSEVRKGKLLPWRSAAECIDWSLPCPSVFDTSAEVMQRHGLRAIRPLKPNTMARIARGIARYVIGAEMPFLVNLTHGARCEDLAEPIRTITGAHRGEKALIVPSITRFNGGATGQDLRDPMATVTANSWIKKPGGAAPLGLISPYLASIAHGYSGGRREYPLAEPLGTVTVGGIQHAVIAPHLMTMRNSAKPFNGAGEPAHTITAGGAGLTLVAPVLSQLYGSGGGNGDLQRPHPTVTAEGQHSTLIAASMVQTGYGERKGQMPRALDIGKPLGTIVAGAAKHSPIAAFLAQHNGGPRMGGHTGHDPREPISTIAGTGSQQMPVTATLEAPPFNEEHAAKARAVADLLRAHDLWDSREFVTLAIDGREFVIVDIGMRMLTPRELFRAQGFPEDYVIEGVWEGTETADPIFRPFPKDVQVSCCGNSVCPPLAEALVRANCQHIAAKKHQRAA